MTVDLRRPGWVLLPQRIFLGVTFCYAGLSKLADPAYLDAGDPESVQRQMAALAGTSPIGPLLDQPANVLAAMGVAIALGEIAVGLGALAGLLTRVAAAGGMALALSFLLTVTWQTRPYYYGADIVFLVAWVPLVLVGAGGVLSADGWLAARRAAAPTAGDVPAAGRRAVLRQGAATAALGLAGLAVAGIARWVGSRGAGRDPGAAGTTPSSARSALLPAAEVPVAGATLVSETPTGFAMYVLQPRAGEYAALSAVCTHAGCVVEWQRTTRTFRCPCHLATYDAAGKPTAGPALRPLAPVPVEVRNGTVRTV